LTLASGGTISGTPTASQQYNFTVKVTDSSSPAQSASRQLSLSITSGSSATPGATATQYVLSYTASNTNECTIEVSTSSTYTPLVHAVDPAIFTGANMDGQTNAGARAFVVGQKWIAQEDVSRPSITVEAGAASRASGSNLVTVSYSNQPFVVGDNITIIGMSNSAYNDSWARVDAASTNSFSYEVLTNAPSGGDTSGGGGIVRADRYSLALAANTTYYYRIGGASNTCGASPATGQFTTMNIPNGNTFAEGPIYDHTSLLQLEPSFFEDRTTTYNDPLTGAQVQRLTLRADYNSYSGGTASKFRTCDKETSNGGYHCWNGASGSTVGALYWINSSTEETRYLGNMYCNYTDAAGKHWNNQISAQQTLGDDTDPNRFYCISDTNQGGAGGEYVGYKEVLGYIEYTGNDVAATQNTQWATATASGGGNLNVLTPEPSTTLTDQMAAFVGSNDPNYTPQKFPGCGQIQTNGIYVVWQCLLQAQDTPGWEFVYNTSTNAIVAGGSTYGNQITRWCGEHGLQDSNSTHWVADSTGHYTGNPVQWNIALVGSLTSSATSTTVRSGIFGWSASTHYNLHYAIIDSNGNLEQVTAGGGGLSGSSAPTWNATVGGTTTDNALTWTNRGIVTNMQSGEPENVYPPQDTNGNTWTHLQSAQASTDNIGGTFNGDLFAFQDGVGAGSSGQGGEVIRVVTKGSCSGGQCPYSKITRGLYGSVASAHAANAVLEPICEPENTGTTNIFWNFLNDAHRTDNTQTYVVPWQAEAAHGFEKEPNMIDGNAVWLIDPTWSSIFTAADFTLATPPNFILDTFLNFNGINTDNSGNGYQGYEVWDFEDASFKNSAIEDSFFLGSIFTGNPATNVTGNIWKYGGSAEGGITFSGSLPYVGMQGLSVLKDISAPSSLLPNTGSNEICVVNVAGECWSGSNAGEVYADLASLVSPYTCQSAGANAPFTGHDWCMVNLPMYGSNIHQLGMVAGNQIGTSSFPEGYTNVPLSDAKNSRRLVQNLWGGVRLQSAYVHTVPDGSYVIYDSCALDPHINQNGGNSGGAYGCQDLMARIPPQPTEDRIDRTNYENVTVKIAGGPSGATHAQVKYGYQENEPSRTTIWPPALNFFCTQYQGACYYPDQNLPLNSQQSFQIGVPQRVLFYEVEYLNASNQIVASDPMTAVAIP